MLEVVGEQVKDADTLDEVMQQFFSGWVYFHVDKGNPEEAAELAKLLTEYGVTDWAYHASLNYSLEDYLKDVETGPYHFFRTEKNIVTGRGTGDIRHGCPYVPRIYTAAHILHLPRVSDCEEEEYLDILLGGEQCS